MKTKSIKKQSPSAYLKLLLCAFWLVAIILPLLKMLSNMAQVDVWAIVSSQKFIKALLHSLLSSLTATALSVGLSGVLAWCVARTNIKRKNIINTLLSVPMLIPSISHGMGLIIILGSNGYLSNLIGLEGGIYGFWGIVLGSVMYSFPVAYLMIYDVLRYEDGTPYEAASVMGLSPINKFFAITLPYLKKPLISILFATFTMIVTDYGVPLMVGGKYMTLPVMMYQDVIGMLDFAKGSVIGAILLLPALIACILDINSKDKGNLAFVGKAYPIKENKTRDRICLCFCISVLIVMFTPIVSFAALGFINKYPLDMSFSLKNAVRAIDMGAVGYLKNSLIISISVAFLGTALAVLNAYLTSRQKNGVSYVLHLMSITSLAVPGIVLGLSYVMFFKKTFLYGTMAILLLANSMHFFASPYLMIYNTFGKINENIENVGETMGIKRTYIIKDVLLPQAKGTILEMMSYFFVNSMMTISAVSFLATTQNKPLALMITRFEGQMQLECAAFVSLLILIVNISMKFLIYIIKKRSS